MTPYCQDELVTLHHGDCLDVLRDLPDGSIDAVVTDPPYNLTFMGKSWDDHRSGNDFQDWCRLWAAECLRVLKPGGHLLAFGGSRTWHRLAAGVEDAGFEIRDSIAWLYGSGFPKSLDVAKAIDKTAGVWRGRAGERVTHNGSMSGPNYEHTIKGDPATAAAAAWSGWGTALKPAFEPIVVARKPLAGTVAANVLEHGTGALNIDACRVEFTSPEDERESKDKNRHADFGSIRGGNEVYGDFSMVERTNYDASGRWPTNVVLEESQAAELDRDGGTSRFFPTFRYEPKAPTAERPRVAADVSEERNGGATTTRCIKCGKQRVNVGTSACSCPEPEFVREQATTVAHPTVKPLDLMRWLVRLVTPPGGLVLDPFAGSGTTGEACVIEGFHCLLIEREADYLPLITQRLTKPIQPDMFGSAS